MTSSSEPSPNGGLHVLVEGSVVIMCDIFGLCKHSCWANDTVVDVATPSINTLLCIKYSVTFHESLDYSE